MIVEVEKDKCLSLTITAETIKDEILLKNLIWMDKTQEWDDLLVYLQQKYENI